MTSTQPGNAESAVGVGDGRVGALLGPTNTGKTHRAIERMLEFDTGMMGLPLRLLAREVYDRVSARLGEQAVALVTGEEKRVPAKPRYWICTAEAMPRDLSVDFLALDEVQLIAHPERGHVFTDRVLHWRGRAETWFMGSDTSERLLRGFVPGLFVNKLPRLSQLTHLGKSSLRTLPRRSAVVAFNLPQVYELADALTARRGGAAVVLGALSPRVRNAQVALYQAGEVDFLVATDAIGMGLNLDIDHVALAGRTKFDGFETRPLEDAELAQIIGRAGRYLRDGTFGTLAPEPELPPGLVKRLESHHFPSQRFAYHRNADWDFSSTQALLVSLALKPSQPHLVSAPDGDDVLVLRVLAKRPEVMQRTRTRRGVQLLWDICRIPNYEKRIPEHQAERLLPLFVQLADHDELTAESVDRELTRLARFDGDIHQLMDRLSGVRTWNYVSHQAGWVEEARDLRERTRELEDKLGDLLHQRLRERFVGKTKRHPPPRAAGKESSVAGPHSPFAKLMDLPMYAAQGDAEHDEQRWVEELIEAPFEAIRIDAKGELGFEGHRIAKLETGPTRLRPELKLLLPDWVSAGTRARVTRRLVAHVRDSVSFLLEPLALDDSASPALRGLFYQLEQGLGSVPVASAREQLRVLSAREFEGLRERGVSVGRFSVFSLPMLEPTRLALRCALVTASLFRDVRASVALASEHVVADRIDQLGREHWFALGFVQLSSVAVRCDAVEELSLRLSPLSLEERVKEIQFVLSCKPERAQALAQELFRTRKRRKRKSVPR
ncbi:MAG: helicase-related protein [Myxococcales bacterium]